MHKYPTMKQTSNDKFQKLKKKGTTFKVKNIKPIVQFLPKKILD